jgi:hypothetical protein
MAKTGHEGKHHCERGEIYKDGHMAPKAGPTGVEMTKPLGDDTRPDHVHGGGKTNK